MKKGTPPIDARLLRAVVALQGTVAQMSPGGRVRLAGEPVLGHWSLPIGVRRPGDE